MAFYNQAPALVELLEIDKLTERIQNLNETPRLTRCNFTNDSLGVGITYYSEQKKHGDWFVTPHYARIYMEQLNHCCAMSFISGLEIENQLLEPKLNTMDHLFNWAERYCWEHLETPYAQYITNDRQKQHHQVLSNRHWSERYSFYNQNSGHECILWTKELA